MTQIKRPNQISGIRLSEKEKAELTKTMGIHSGAERRRHTRYLLPKEFTLLVCVSQGSGSSPSFFTVTPRDISTSGIGFFHATYIHPGTQCVMMMRSLRGESVSLKGAIMRCRHVTGRVHEIGVSFDEAVAVEEFVADLSRHADSAGDACNQKLEQIHTRLAVLAAELKHLAESHAPTSELLAKVGELASIVAPAPDACSPEARIPAPGSTASATPPPATH